MKITRKHETIYQCIEVLNREALKVDNLISHHAGQAALPLTGEQAQFLAGYAHGIRKAILLMRKTIAFK